MKDVSTLAKSLGVKFKDIDLLQQALIHRSYLNEHPSFRLGHNERLEFLGDAVLELIITEHLYRLYPDAPEGELTNLRAALVNAKMLSQISGSLGVEDFLALSKGEARDAKGKARQFILANAFEAITGAIYLDQGMEAARGFIERAVVPELARVVEQHLEIDPKSQFQEVAQEKVGVTPTYKVISESGPDHDKQFVVGVYLSSEQIATGRGSSKQEAQLDAAAKALKVKGW